MGRAADPPIASQFKKAVGQRLRAYRESEDISQTVFAARLGISRDRYANYEDGSHEMPYWLLDKLERVTGKDVRYWITGKAAHEGNLGRFRVVR